jgi:hypothetical protein
VLIVAPTLNSFAHVEGIHREIEEVRRICVHHARANALQLKTPRVQPIFRRPSATGIRLAIQPFMTEGAARSERFMKAITRRKYQQGF